MKTTFTSRIVFKNSFWTGLDKFTSVFFQFIISLLLARYLFVTEVGNYYIVVSFVSIFSFFYDFGINDITIREISRNHSITQKIFQNIFPFKIILSCMALLIILLFSKIYPGTRSLTFNIFLYGLYYVILYCILQLQAFFVASENFKIVTFINIFMKVFLIIMIILFYLKGIKELKILFVLYIIASFAALFILIIKFQVNYNLKWIFNDIDMTLIWDFVKKGFPIALAGIVGIVIHNVDILVIRLYWDSKIVAFYSMAYIIGMSVRIIPNTYVSAVFPRISRYYKTSIERFNKIFLISIKLSVLIGLLIPIIGIPFSKEILYLIYGQQYIAGESALKIIFLMGFLVIPSGILTYFMIASDKQKEYLFFVTIAFFINFVGDLILIPFFPIEGGAIATLFSSVFITYALLMVFKKRDKINLEQKTFLLPILILIVVLAIQSFLTNIIFILCFTVISVLAIFIIFYKSSYFSHEEKLIFSELKGILT